MRSRRRVVACVAMAGALAIGAGTAPRAAVPVLQRVYSARFPSGNGQEIASRSCVACHSPTLVTQQSKDSTAWEKTLGQMQQWGVALTPGERDSLRGYLVRRFGRREVAGR